MPFSFLTKPIGNFFSRIAVSFESDTLDISDWDEKLNRQTRLHLYELFYTNDIFNSTNDLLDDIKSEFGLYRHIRGIYNPVERLIESYSAAVYGGSLNLKDFSTGAILIDFPVESEKDEVRQVLKDSQWYREKGRYVRTTSVFGDSFLKVVENEDQDRVYIEILDPRLVGDFEVDDFGNITYFKIEAEIEDGEEVIPYIEEITPEEFIITLNDEEIDRYENPYGFVPVVKATFKDMGRKWGHNAFHGQIAKIFEINDVGSLLDDNVRNTVEQIMHANGIAKGNISTNTDEPTRDMLRILYTPAGGSLEPIKSTLNIDGALNTIRVIKEELEADLPTLSLQDLRQRDRISSVAIKAAYSDAIKRIKEIQSNLDSSLRNAIVMAIAIRGFRALNTFNLEYYINDEAEFEFREREVISDSLSEEQRLNHLHNVDINDPLAPYVLQRLGVPEEVVRDAQERQEKNREARLEERLMENETRLTRGLRTRQEQPEQEVEVAVEVEE